MSITSKILWINSLIQEYVENRYPDKTYIKFVKTHFDDTNLIISEGENKYIFDDMFFTIKQAKNEYDYSMIKPDDIVLDIGACIGSYSIPASGLAKKVYAVEPIMKDRLTENIRLNGICNIEVIGCGLGRGKTSINWQGKQKNIICYPLIDIISMCGGHIDVLKCDCEGAEWRIRPGELKNIRAIEMEVHHLNKNMPQLKNFEKILDDAGFIYRQELECDILSHVHATKIS